MRKVAFILFIVFATVQVAPAVMALFSQTISVFITDEEKTIIEQLLQSMIQHCKILGSTSIAGLRQTFLLRQGWLSLEENHWQLKVQPGTFDMLLDQLPWTIALIKHGWMDKPLHVNWR